MRCGDSLIDTLHSSPTLSFAFVDSRGRQVYLVLFVSGNCFAENDNSRHVPVATLAIHCIVLLVRPPTTLIHLEDIAIMPCSSTSASRVELCDRCSGTADHRCDQCSEVSRD